MQRKLELTSLAFAVVVELAKVFLFQLRPNLLLYLINRMLLLYGSFFLLEYCLRPICYRTRRRWLNASWYNQCLAFSLQTRVEAMNLIFSHHILICVFNDKDSPSIGLRPLVRCNLRWVLIEEKSFFFFVHLVACNISRVRQTKRIFKRIFLLSFYDLCARVEDESSKELFIRVSSRGLYYKRTCKLNGIVSPCFIVHSKILL